MVGLFVVFGCGNRCVPELVLIPMSPWLTGYWALLILQVAWLLGYTASQGYLPAFATSTSTRGRAVAGRRSDRAGRRRGPSSVRGRCLHLRVVSGAAILRPLADAPRAHGVGASA
jgi:hypothetical protein